MNKYFYREHLINTSQKDSIITDTENNEVYTIQLFYNSGMQRFLTQGLGKLMNGSTSIFNIRIKSMKMNDYYTFYQKPLHKNLIGTKWDVYVNDQKIGLLKTKLDVSKDKMWLVLDDDETITFESVKLSAKTYGYHNDKNIFSAHTERFSPVSKHEIEVDSSECNEMLLIGVFQTFFTFLEMFK